MIDRWWNRLKAASRSIYPRYINFDDGYLHIYFNVYVIPVRITVDMNQLIPQLMNRIGDRLRLADMV